MSTPSDHTSDETLVALAYAMAIGPERLYDLQIALSARLEHAARSREDQVESDVVSAEFGPLEPHFEQALNLLHGSAKQRKPAWTAIQLMEQDHRALATLARDGQILYANDAAQRSFALSVGSQVPGDLLEPDQAEALRAALIRLGSVEDNRILGIFKLLGQLDGEPRQMGLKQVVDDSGTRVGHLFEMSATWDTVLADKFRALMKLTGVEVEILRAIVTGMTLSDLAQLRERKVSTVRLQAKRLLAKLHLRSQTELACLYAAFVENEARGMRSPAWDEGRRPAPMALTSARGQILTYEFAGPASGRPVLFLTALLGGTTLTPAMYRALFARNVRLIMVWRPGMAGCSPPGKSTMEAFSNYAADVADLLDHLGIRCCPVMGHITSIMFAFGLACHQPDRISGVIGVNPTTPCHSGPHVSAISMDEKLRFLLMRRAPKVGRMLVHAMLSKVEAGFDEEFLSRFLDNSIDHETMRDPDLRNGFRDAFARSIEQGYDSFSHELALGGLDWQPLVDATRCPVVLLAGAKNPVYTRNLLATYVGNRPDTQVIEVAQAAHLLLYQQTGIVLDAVAQMDHAPKTAELT